MSQKDRFIRVLDAIEDDPVRVENSKLRSTLMIEIAERINDQRLTQTQTAELLHITQRRVSALLMAIASFLGYFLGSPSQ